MIRNGDKVFYVLLEDNGNHDLFYDINSRRDNIAAPFIYLKNAVENAGLIFKPTFNYTDFPDAAVVVSFCLLNQTIFQSIQKLPKEKCFIFLMEPPFLNFGRLYDKSLANYFGKIFTFYDELVDNKCYFKFYHEQYNEAFVKDAPSFEDKKFSVMVHSNHFINHPKECYSERRKVAEYFQNKDELDIYGARWEGFSSAKGSLNNGKLDLIKNYKFCFCYESAKDQYGCISNKLFDVFWAKSVPIYYGPLNVNDYIPRECFINLQEFSSYDDLYKFIKGIDKKTYENYIEAAKAFLETPQSEVFKPRQLSKTIMEHIPR